LEKADADIPTILTAHCSVQGASFGGERTVMLGNDLVLPASLVRDPRLDYVALGHIHKPQDLNQNPSDPLGHNHPPVIYPGSIERVDFGEAADKKFFVIAHVTRGRTEVEWRELTGIRPFVDRFLRLEQSEGITQQMIDCLPAAGDLKGVIARLVIEYPREWEALIDETALRQHTRDCLEFNLVKRPQMQARIRIPNDQSVGSLMPFELLDLYWSASHTDPQDVEALNQLAAEMMREVHGDEEVD
jgi:exonuclease SbcD